MALNFRYIKSKVFWILYFLNNLFNPKEILKNITLIYDFKKLVSNKEIKLIEKKTKKKALILCYPNINSILIQSFFLISLKIKGFELIGLIHSYNFSIQTIYKFFGVKRFTYFFDAFSNKKKKEIFSFEKKYLKELDYKKIPVGKIILSTLMRKHKTSNLTQINKEEIQQAYDSSINLVDFFCRKFDKLNPEILVLLDRGYTPEAEIFHTSLIKNIKSVEVHLGHRSDFLAFKKYSLNNKNDHFNSLSKKTLRFLDKKKIKSLYKRKVFDELKFCYESGKWFEEVGTQIEKKNVNKKIFIKKFNLDPNKKIAVLFSHIFWDGTFFYGEDLFIDYEDWFRETLKVMIKKKDVNWIIKVHPANVVKNKRDIKINTSEVDILNSICKKKPKNIILVDSNDSISTFSYFNFIDYCLTVRGTVGIEAACFGIPVITAGTGRYDGNGFTIDHKSKKDYLSTIRNIDKIKKYSKQTTNKAILFAYTLFCKRVFSTQNIKFFFERDQKFSMKANIDSVNVYLENETKLLSEWLISDDEDFINDTFS